jgi:TRAP-type mannitol/chloroaromatic compound transport system permease small subunit
MKLLLKVSRAIDAFTEILGKISTYLVVVIIAVGILNVFLRFLGRFSQSDLFSDITKAITGRAYPSNILTDLQWYIFAVMFFLGFGYILKHGVNVRVDFLYSKWSARRKAWVDLLGTLLFLIPFCLLGIYVAIPQVMQSYGYGSFKPTSDLLAWLADLRRIGDWEVATENGIMPRAPIKTFVILGFVFLLLQAVSQAIKYLAVVVGHEEVLKVIREDEQPEVQAVLEEIAERAKQH